MSGVKTEPFGNQTKTTCNHLSTRLVRNLDGYCKVSDMNTLVDS